MSDRTGIGYCRQSRSHLMIYVFIYIVFISACFIITIAIRMLSDSDGGNFIFQNCFDIL